MAAERNITFNTAHDSTSGCGLGRGALTFYSRRMWSVRFLHCLMVAAPFVHRAEAASTMFSLDPLNHHVVSVTVRPLVLALSSSGLVWTRFLCTLTGQWQNSLIDVAASSHTRPSSTLLRRPCF